MAIRVIHTPPKEKGEPPAHLKDLPTYYLVGRDDDVRRMMGNAGWMRLNRQEDADVLVFIGGPDVNPFLYGEKRHPKTSVSLSRDLEDIEAFRKWKGPMEQGLIGICRGAQFLNVMSGGGKLWQHVSNHANGPHMMYTSDPSRRSVLTSSTHHQMMIPGPNADIMAKAGQATLLECDRLTRKRTLQEAFDDRDEPEVIFYPYMQTFCFQGHPEIPLQNNTECREYFLEKIESLFVSDPIKRDAMKKHQEFINKERR